MRNDIVGALAGAKLIGCSKAAEFKRWAADNGVAPVKVGTTRKRKHFRWRVADILRAHFDNASVVAGKTDAVVPGPIPESGWLGW